MLFHLLMLVAVGALTCGDKWDALLAPSYDITSKVCHVDTSEQSHQYHCFEAYQCRQATSIPGTYQGWSDEGRCDGPCEFGACVITTRITGDGVLDSDHAQTPRCTDKVTYTAQAAAKSLISKITVNDEVVFENPESTEITEKSFIVTALPSSSVHVEFTPTPVQICPVQVDVNAVGSYVASEPNPVCGTQVVFTVTPNPGYFVESMVGNDLNFHGSDDGSADETMSLTVTKYVDPMTLRFRLKTCPIQVDVNAGGSYVASEPNPVCGTQVVFTVTPSAGYFVQSMVGNDLDFHGSDDGSYEGTLSLTVTKYVEPMTLRFVASVWCTLRVQETSVATNPVSGSRLNCGEPFTLEVLTPDNVYVESLELDGAPKIALTQTLGATTFALTLLKGQANQVTVHPQETVCYIEMLDSHVHASPVKAACGFSTHITTDAFGPNDFVDALLNGVNVLVRYNQYLYQQQQLLDLVVTSHLELDVRNKPMPSYIMRVINLSPSTITEIHVDTFVVNDETTRMDGASYRLSTGGPDFLNLNTVFPPNTKVKVNACGSIYNLVTRENGVVLFASVPAAMKCDVDATEITFSMTAASEQDL